MTNSFPELGEILSQQRFLSSYLVETPVLDIPSSEALLLCGVECELYLKLELLQRTGTFKPRGVLTVMSSLSSEQLDVGVTAVSAGNHGIAVAYGAQLFNSSAKVVMPKTANPFRVKRCKELGAEVVLCRDIQEAFETVEQIQEEEGRYFVHPFDGPQVALGTATLGVEFVRQVPGMDIAVVAVGGGGLAAGVSAAIKQLLPETRIVGVEPEGANTMYRSFLSNRPETISKVNTMADSLGAPAAMQYSFSVCKKFMESIVMVSDEQIARAMVLMFERLKIVAEPAAAAALAAVCGPLREEVEGKKVGIVVCGSNIDFKTYASTIAKYGLPDAL